jgi:hypothetical protein
VESRDEILRQILTFIMILGFITLPKTIAWPNYIWNFYTFQQLPINGVTIFGFIVLCVGKLILLHHVNKHAWLPYKLRGDNVIKVIILLRKCWVCTWKVKKSWSSIKPHCAAEVVFHQFMIFWNDKWPLTTIYTILTAKSFL